MNDLNFLYPLIRLSLGTETSVSHYPSADEWNELYKMAHKHSLVGVCFVRVRRCMEAAKAEGRDAGILRRLYMQWLASAMQIQKMNERMNQRCVELQTKLSSSGLRNAILKGQAVATLYNVEEMQEDTPLSELRHPGDIDVYVDCGREKAIEFANSIGQQTIDWDYKHLHLHLFQDIEVEMHYRPEVLLNLVKNRRLQRWFAQDETQRKMFCQQGTLVAPSVELNLFYILLHIYRHFLYEGVGLRQLMDYFFVLKAVDSQTDTRWSKQAIESFGIKRFASGVMWIMQHVFGLEKQFLLYKPDEREGKYILTQVMAGGNFGHHDERQKTNCKHSSSLGAVKKILKHNLHLLAHYPMEAFWAPLWIVYHWCWKRAVK